MKTLFGTDGIRGIVGEDLNAETVMRIGWATANVISKDRSLKPRILIGTDTRISSPMLESALVAGLRSAGADTHSLGIVPTPSVAYLTVKNEFDAGIMISASHNPYEYNGIKIFAHDGFKLPDESEEAIEVAVNASGSTLPECKKDRFGTEAEAVYGMDDYISHISEGIGDLSGLKIAIDLANGSCVRTARSVFPSLGCECHFIGCEPSGLNVNDACGSTDLERLKTTVIQMGLDLGIAFDGDGDRCLAVDERGNEVDGDQIMAIIAKWLKMQGKLYNNGIVGTVMTNLGFVEFCKSEGINYESSRVGDRYVLELMRERGYFYGAEQSGHIILRERATTGDGQLTAAYLLRAVKESSSSLSSLCGAMKKFAHHLNLKVKNGQKAAFMTDNRIKRLLEDSERQLGKGRLVVRPSGTEPLIRIMTEGEDEELIRSVAERLHAELKAML